MPADVGFATKPDIALQQVRQTMEADIKTGIVFADADYYVGVHEDLTLPLYHHAGRALGVPDPLKVDGEIASSFADIRIRVAPGWQYREPRI